VARCDAAPAVASALRRSPRRAGEERVAVHVVGACVRLALRSAEGVDGRADLDRLEPGFLEHPLPARPGQPACDSAGPEVDVAQRFGWDGLSVGDVRELEGPAGA
jgi:hypothetical protein